MEEQLQGGNMRASPAVALTLLTTVVSAVRTNANTWYVGGWGADFDEIQPAIDAASDWDLILVRPVKDYRGFVINKGVTVRATAGRFDLHGSNTIQITNVPSGRAARLSNVEMLHSYCSLEVSHCAGEVLLDDVQLGSPDQVGAYAARIASSANVHISDIAVWLGRFQNSVAPLTIENSVVQMTSVNLTAGKNETDYNGCDGMPGAPALICTRSWVVIDLPNILGGEGGDSGDACLCSSPKAGDGGAGIDASESVVLVMGLPGEVVKGGTGGKLVRSYYSCPGDAGTGGTGLVSDDSIVQVSGAALVGGKGGPISGGGQGSDGEPFEGPVQFVSPPFPVLDVSLDLHPGAQFTETIHGEASARALLLLSDRRAWVSPPNGVVGAPFSALPGSWFVAIQGGLIPPDGLKLTLGVPSDPLVRGFAITSQAVVFAPDPPISLTNAVHRVVGE